MARDPSPANRIRALLDNHANAADPERRRAAHDLLSEGSAYALRLEAKRARLDRRAEELAVAPHELDAASELRRLWLELSGTARELEELRRMLALLRPLANWSPAA